MHPNVTVAHSCAVCATWQIWLKTVPWVRLVKQDLILSVKVRLLLCPVQNWEGSPKTNWRHKLAAMQQISITSRLVFMAQLRPQVRMPPARNARRTLCPIPSSKRAQIPNFRTCSIPNLWTRTMSSFWMYLFAARLCQTLPAANVVVRCATGTPQRIGACSEHAVLAAGA